MWNNRHCHQRNTDLNKYFVLLEKSRHVNNICEMELKRKKSSQTVNLLFMQFHIHINIHTDYEPLNLLSTLMRV